jgi:hypothetical protein
MCTECAGTTADDKVSPVNFFLVLLLKPGSNQIFHSLSMVLLMETNPFKTFNPNGFD